MLKGILSGRIPPALRERGEGWLEGEAAYSTALTPKGKIVTDLRLIPSLEAGFLMDLPGRGLEKAEAHFRKYLNPRFATLEDRSGDLGVLTVVGPEGAETVASVLGFGLERPEGGELHFRPGPPEPGIWVLGNTDVWPPALDLILPSTALEEVAVGLEGAGVYAMDAATWEVLRIETGTPRFGVDMTEDTIPVEAGIEDRAIDYGKGCYTGQEVIIRIRDRGKVNKYLRGILLGSAAVPPAGTELFLPTPVPGRELESPSPTSGSGLGEPLPSGPGKKVGWVTSACASPRFGQTIALGFVKREIGVGGVVSLGAPGGPAGRIVALGDAGG